MFERSHLERVLKINGVSPTAPDEVIRELLISARYSETEIESALSVLRENVVTHDTTLESSHKIFRGDASLNSQEISKLLGIDVNVSQNSRLARDGVQPSIGKTAISVLVLAVIVFVAVVVYLYVSDIV